MNFKIFKNLKINIVHDYVLLLKKKKLKVILNRFIKICSQITVNTWSKNLF